MGSALEGAPLSLDVAAAPKCEPRTPLHDLAAAVGVMRSWRSAEGSECLVADEVLVSVLSALGYAAGSDDEIRQSFARWREEALALPGLITAEQGSPVRLPKALAHLHRVDLVSEDSGISRALPAHDGLVMAIEEPGYYRLHAGGQSVRLAVAPHRAFSLGHDLHGLRTWGAAIQIPSLRKHGPAPFGDLGALADAAVRFAGLGADALAISPVHAIFASQSSGFSPYAPSSRLFLNAALAAPELAGLEPYAEPEGAALIDWDEALPRRLESMRKLHAACGSEVRKQVDAWAAKVAGARGHALFDALSLHFAAHGRGWKNWPSGYHDPSGRKAKRFAGDHAEEIRFHLFAQWLAARSMKCVQQSALEAGMKIGIVKDLAVGSDPLGSDAWAMQESVLSGLTIGAPPDPLGPDGQNWGLTSFSPRGLVASGFEPWLAMLRAGLRDAGGLRIDHAFGLARLWVIPEGEPAGKGAYLNYPIHDLTRLVALESRRAQALIVAEDLGTRPPGFDHLLSDREFLGMRVLWFERDDDGGFQAASRYDRSSAAMTGTHDTATVAGWWSGRDLEWNRVLGRGATGEAADDRRSADRAALWRTIGEGKPQPLPSEPADAVDAAICEIARAGSDLAIVPLEDILGLEEQPNLPGTVDEHPNWRRRMTAPLDAILDGERVAARIAMLDGRRSMAFPEEDAASRSAPPAV